MPGMERSDSDWVTSSTMDSSRYSRSTRRADLFSRLVSFIKDTKFLKLLACLLVDLIGLASYLLPGLGEFLDAFWAPISAYFLHVMFGTFLIPLVGLLEELGPGTDFIPTATIAFTIEQVECLGPLRRVLGMRSGTGAGAGVGVGASRSD